MNLLPAVGMALILGAPGPKNGPKKEDAPTIVGEWECTECVAGGRTATADEVVSIGIDFTADGKFRNRWGKQISNGTYATDPAKDPAQLDCVSAKTGKTGQMIYKIEKDKLTVCGGEGGAARPTKFESPDGTRIMVLTYKRMEKKKE